MGEPDGGSIFEESGRGEMEGRLRRFRDPLVVLMAGGYVRRTYSGRAQWAGLQSLSLCPREETKSGREMPGEGEETMNGKSSCGGVRDYDQGGRCFHEGSIPYIGVTVQEEGSERIFGESPGRSRVIV
tara:strand:- start:158 stop:541 length:384 start_codon:yes stop_codon:yes gene_type:complete